MIGSRSNREAEAFANALDDRGPRSSEVDHLVRLAQGLRESAIEPAPEFLRSLRGDLMTEAATVLVKTGSTTKAARSTSHPVRRRLVAAAAAGVAMAGSVSIVASSSQALPGDMLYPVKRSVESIELTLHRGDADRGAFELAQASERLAEARSLAGEDDSRSKQFVAEALEQFTVKAQSGSQALFNDYSGDGDRASIEKVSEFATSSSSMLGDISDKLPANGPSNLLTAAATTVTDLVAQVTSLCSDCDVASLSSITKRVGELNSTAADTPRDTTKAEPKAPNQTTPSAVTAPQESTALTPPKTSTGLIPVVPSPTPVVEPTKTLVGTLLGDDSQEGVVPGLLNGLLGSN